MVLYCSSVQRTMCIVALCIMQCAHCAMCKALQLHYGSLNCIDFLSSVLCCIALLAPQSDAHRITPHRDFHPNPTQPKNNRPPSHQIPDTLGTRIGVKYYSMLTCPRMGDSVQEKSKSILPPIADFVCLWCWAVGSMLRENVMIGPSWSLIHQPRPYSGPECTRVQRPERLQIP